MSWRLAKSLEKLREQVNLLSPKRNKSSDGTIGDEAHASRSSDHNPWIVDGSSRVVSALDITHDISNGVDCNAIAEALKNNKDKRIKYIIWNKRISNPTIEQGAWRKYTGRNPHDKHIHISVNSSKSLYDDTNPWNLKVVSDKIEEKKSISEIPPKLSVQPLPKANKVYVYCLYGLGGAFWSGGIETVVATQIRKILNVVCPPTRNFTEWKQIVDSIKKQPKGSKTVVIGHSLGAVSATFVTDFVPVDLLILYDLAGGRPSKIGKNTTRVIDIYDTIPDIVPEWRVQALPGHENKIDLWESRYGHTGQDDSLELANRVVEEVRQLA